MHDAGIGENLLHDSVDVPPLGSFLFTLLFGSPFAFLRLFSFVSPCDDPQSCRRGRSTYPTATACDYVPVPTREKAVYGTNPRCLHRCHEKNSSTGGVLSKSAAR